ncbi:MAG: hypothetical protein KAI29_32000 [Cyclobacteriaceae bacterium]|nr:hypothetical protein [Cyclobacteriaceae bacterium]
MQYAVDKTDIKDGDGEYIKHRDEIHLYGQKTGLKLICHKFATRNYEIIM